jgi:hypothetical protein
MLVGVDFDNTIVSYDQLFHRLAVSRRLIPPEIEASKGQVRDYLRRRGKEEDWIELQGYAYGAAMRDAVPFPGVRDFFARCHSSGVRAYIISHRTRFPFKGPDCDLHQAAHEWLEAHGFFSSTEIGLSPGWVYFESTKRDKLARIVERGCTHFIDDLPEFLSDEAFPENVQRFLFDPYDNFADEPRFIRVASWAMIGELLSIGSRAPHDGLRRF